MCWGVFAKESSTPLSQQGENTRIKAVVKMYFIVGPTWLMEILGWYLKYHTSIGKCGSRKVLIFFDIVNALQGFFLFLVFYFDKERTFTNSSKYTRAQHQNANETLNGRTVSTYCK